MKNVKVFIDGAWWNATHYASLSKEESVKRMMADGNSPDAAHAAQAYDKCVDAVKKAKDEEAKKKAAKK